jgi:two-component system, cell cycle sensor histidine kinase and response regulator CckA
VMRMRHKDGHWVWIQDRGAVVQWDEDGAPLLMTGTHIDVTATKEAQEERVKLQARLLEAQKMEAIGQFAGGIAHDFNNLLTTINGYAELIVSELPLDDPLYAMADEILSSGKRAAAEVGQLIDFAHQQMAAPQIVQLDGLLRDMQAPLRAQLPESIELEVSIAENLWPIKANSDQIERMLHNLAHHAQTMMPEGGRLAVEVTNACPDLDDADTDPILPPGDYVYLKVNHTGKRVDPDVQQRVFEPFFIRTNAVADGVGLRLAVVYGIVKHHGGHIWLESHPERGSTFWICLPRHVPEKAT